MRAGAMDRKVTLQGRSSSQSSYGEAEASYSNLTNGEVWAEIKPLSGNEQFTADQILAESLTEFRIRYRSDIDATCRIVYGGKNYDIRYVSEIGRREGLKIIASLINP